MQAELTDINSNAPNIQHAFDFLGSVLRAALIQHFNPAADQVAVPDLAYFDDESGFGEFIKKFQPTFGEYVILLLAAAPHIRPGFLEKIIKEALPESGDFPEIGGAFDKEYRRFLPTGETVLFLLAGDNLEKRFEIQGILTGDHWFTRDNILKLEPAPEGHPFWSGRLLLNPEYIEMFTQGRISNPSFSPEFPAREVETDLSWNDLVLNPSVLEQIEDVKQWIVHNETLMNEWGMSGKIKPGYRALFFGPPGTGKTLTATLLGKYTGRSIFRIDLSTLVSKYIGETEKNLSNLFDKARGRKWILFFDEADALFGKRTDVKEAHDRFANQEISYLLQLVEDFDGLVILASNFKANIDDAFLRRFNSIIGFPFPNEAERVMIWRKSLPSVVQFEKNIDLPALLGKFEMSGGNIINIVQYMCLAAISRNSNTIGLTDALRGIKREVEKEGKVFKNVIEGEVERQERENVNHARQ